MEPIIQNEKVLALLDPNPISKGHVIVSPTEQVVILEQAEDEIVGELFKTANSLSSTLFDVLGAQGSNILIQNGMAAGQEDPQLSLNVIPRFEDDGLNFQWQSEQTSEESLNENLKLIQEALANPVPQNQEVPKEMKPVDPVEKNKWIEKAMFRLP